MNTMSINKYNYDLSTTAGHRSLDLERDNNSLALAPTKIPQQDATMQPAYMNTGSDGSKSVKYYVLEDASTMKRNS